MGSAPWSGWGKLLGVRAADPAGGPDWALRLAKTSRGLGCVQLGRLVDGKLGVLGRDNAFANDGRFHERGAQIVGQTDCQQPDAAGHTFIAMSYVGLPDSGDATACAARAHQTDLRPVCPRGSLRTVYYGLLGPHARAVTYLDPTGAVVRQRVGAPEGAYLVVQRTDPKRRNIGYFTPGDMPRDRPAQRGVPRRQRLPHRQRATPWRRALLPAEGLRRAEAPRGHPRRPRRHGPRPRRHPSRAPRTEAQATQGAAADSCTASASP